jgi:hypothetical protein
VLPQLGVVVLTRGERLVAITTTTAAAVRNPRGLATDWMLLINELADVALAKTGQVTSTPPPFLSFGFAHGPGLTRRVVGRFDSLDALFEIPEPSLGVFTLHRRTRVASHGEHHAPATHLAEKVVRDSRGRNLKTALLSPTVGARSRSRSEFTVLASS